jgi:hypothetical protein
VIYLGKFYWEFERYVKKGPVNGQLSAYGPCWGAWRASFTGTFENKKKMHMWVPFLGPRRQ